MDEQAAHGGIEVGKKRLEVAVWPSGKRFAARNDEQAMETAVAADKCC